MSMDTVISFLALGVSGYALYKTIQFNKLQQDVDNIQTALNRLLLRREENEALEAVTADLAATFIKYGKSGYKLKIFNKGKSVARNVRIEFPEGNEMLIQSDVDSKFPLERLEQFQPVELIAAVYMGSPSKMAIKLIWDDDSKLANEKILYPTR